MLFVLAVLIAAASPEGERWTFCVAESGEGVWITSVFALQTSREKLETNFASWLRRRGVGEPRAQCPAPEAEKADVFNAQFTAAEFHRKLGHTLHTVDWPPRQR